MDQSALDFPYQIWKENSCPWRVVMTNQRAASGDVYAVRKDNTTPGTSSTNCSLNQHIESILHSLKTMEVMKASHPSVRV